MPNPARNCADRCYGAWAMADQRQDNARHRASPTPSAAQEPPGLASRRAALRMLDGVLRRGQPLEQGMATATRDVALPADRALAHSITATTLRHLTDLDALIDSATRQRLPDDAKARMVL